MGNINILQAMKDALTWMERVNEYVKYPIGTPTIESLRSAIEEMEKAEPVAWMDPNGDIYDEEYEVWKAWNTVGVKPKGFKPRPLYLHPTPR